MPDPVQLCGSLEAEHPEFRDGFKCNQPLGHCRLNHGGQFWDHAVGMNRWNDPDNPSIAHPAEQVCTAVDDCPGEAGKRRCQYAVGHPPVRSYPRPGCGWPLPKFSHGAPTYRLWWNDRLVAQTIEAPQAKPADDAPPTLAAQLAQWWRDTAESEIDKTVAKAVEYGARDLVEIGRQLVESGVQLPPDLRLSIPGRDHDAHFAELGVYFYAVGKMARWTSAVAEGRRVSDDTLFDIGVYIRMAQRIRQTGQWP